MLHHVLYVCWCEPTAADHLRPSVCVCVTRSPEGRDWTIDFTFGLLPCRQTGKLTHPLCEQAEGEGERRTHLYAAGFVAYLFIVYLCACVVMVTALGADAR